MIMKPLLSLCGAFLVGVWLFNATSVASAADANGGAKNIVLVAGTPSHGPGEHEFNAGVLLLKRCLNEVPGINATANLNGWPKDPHAFDGADEVVFFMDGGPNHPIIQDDHLQIIGRLMDRGVGLACLHYAVEVPKDKGGPEFLKWIGGYYEDRFSTNPHWDANIVSLPDHPITRGVKPFHILDEWYYNMRFRPGMEGVTPLLVAKPSDETRQGKTSWPRGPYPHIVAASGRAEVLSWCVERADGGRGFGFTGAHFHKNWGDENFRKFVLNALLWTAKAEVPSDGVNCQVTAEQLAQNLDPKGRRPSASNAATPAAIRSPAFKSDVVRSGTVKVEANLDGAKDLWLVVADGGDGFGCDWADWVEPKLVKSDGSAVRLTDLKWKQANAGWGQVRIDHNANGGPMKIAGQSIANGIGTHAPSVIHYELPGAFARLEARAGVDNGGTDQGCGSTVQFFVFTRQPPRALLAASSGGGGGGGGNRGSGLDAAEQDLAKMTVADGLAVTLFASEPMLLNPADMDVDARGRVWATEGVNYRGWSKLRPAGDRIVILEDTNGDGLADEGKTFYQGNEINTALGIAVLGDKVIVSCSPNVYIFTDANHDDKADGPPQVLFSGISGHQHDHGVHAFVFGPDGKLYFNFGNAGERIKRPDGSPVVDKAGNQVNNSGHPYRQGMVFRCNLDGSEFETLAWNFRNNYEVCVDSFGNLWQSDNDDDGNRGVRINYVMQYGNYGYTDEMTGAGWGTAWKAAQARGASESERPYYHWHQYDPGVVPNLLQTGNGSPTGICAYEGDLLPPIFRDQIIHCDAGPRVVRAYPVKPDGAGFDASIENILTSSDSWFRPSDVCIAPDGSLYIADWNDPGVGGHAMGDHDVATMRGRIYRVAPPGHKPVVPKLDLNTPAGCVAALQSPNMATRYLAWTRLHAMGPNAEQPLESLWHSQDARMRARAIQLLARIPGREKHYVDAAIEDADPNLRIVGLRTARELGFDMIPYVQTLVRDQSPQVRRECAIDLRHNGSPAAPGLWAILAGQYDGKDRWYLEALGIGMDQQEDKYFNAWLAMVGDNWDTPAGHEIVWRSRARKAPALLVKIITKGNLSEGQKTHYLRALDFIKGPEKDAALVDLITAGVN